MLCPRIIQARPLLDGTKLAGLDVRGITTRPVWKDRYIVDDFIMQWGIVSMRVSLPYDLLRLSPSLCMICFVIIFMIHYETPHNHLQTILHSNVLYITLHYKQHLFNLLHRECAAPCDAIPISYSLPYYPIQAQHTLSQGKQSLSQVTSHKSQQQQQHNTTQHNTRHQRQKKISQVTTQQHTNDMRLN